MKHMIEGNCLSSDSVWDTHIYQYLNEYLWLLGRLLRIQKPTQTNVDNARHGLLYQGGGGRDAERSAYGVHILPFVIKRWF
jgi:hypothetical protein